MAKRYRRKSKLTEILAPILERYPGTIVNRGCLMFLPIGLFERGLAFQKSIVPDMYYISVYALALYGGRAAGWGERQPIPHIAYNSGWYASSDRFLGDLTTLIEETVKPHVANVTNGAAFNSYIRFIASNREGMSRSLDEPGYPLGLGYLQMGDLVRARENFLAHKAFLKHIKEAFLDPNPDRLDPDHPLEQNLEALLDLLEHDPEGVPAHCDEATLRCVKHRRLEDYWEPVKFTYSGMATG